MKLVKVGSKPTISSAKNELDIIISWYYRLEDGGLNTEEDDQLFEILKEVREGFSRSMKRE